MTRDERARISSKVLLEFYEGESNEQVVELVDDLIDEWGLNTKAIIHVFGVAKEHEKLRNFEWITDFANKNFMNYPHEDYNEKLNERVRIMTEYMSKIIQKPLNGYELLMIEKWIGDYMFDETHIEYACECNCFRDVITMKDVDDKLSEWYRNGLYTFNEVKAYEKNLRIKQMLISNPYCIFLI